MMQDSDSVFVNIYVSGASGDARQFDHEVIQTLPEPITTSRAVKEWGNTTHYECHFPREGIEVWEERLTAEATERSLELLFDYHLG